MTSAPELSYRRIVRALERAGFVVRRQGRHLSMYSPERNVVAIIPRHNPVKRTTLLRILKDIDMTLEEFRELLRFVWPPEGPGGIDSRGAQRGEAPLGSVCGRAGGENYVRFIGGYHATSHLRPGSESQGR